MQKLIVDACALRHPFDCFLVLGSWMTIFILVMILVVVLKI